MHSTQSPHQRRQLPPGLCRLRPPWTMAFFIARTGRDPRAGTGDEIPRARLAGERGAYRRQPHCRLCAPVLDARIRLQPVPASLASPLHLFACVCVCVCVNVCNVCTCVDMISIHLSTHLPHKTRQPLPPQPPSPTSPAQGQVPLPPAARFARRSCFASARASLARVPAGVAFARPMPASSG